ncbi:putative fatty acid synthase alpha subunit [Mycena maculata]|uniref:beta-ketoacyl-[acyl-carrier-protein] synthase I n=1 Tax=Mycena maculata TaxID=230809 RepID=A0AAD7IG99_9AGAR|nr:putative fatty acid synthase alpha subunit [Mycena maculata]
MLSQALRRELFMAVLALLGLCHGMLDMKKVESAVQSWKWAWLMGYIKHFDGRLKDGALYVGWVDSKSRTLRNPSSSVGTTQRRRSSTRRLSSSTILSPLKLSNPAHKFKLQHSDKCNIWAGEGGQWFFKLKKGALMFMPKSFSFSRTVGGQIPSGWHAGRYGIPDDIIAQANQTTRWALVAKVEALNMSGITDPYELYKHVHPSEVGTSLGSGMGGTISMGKMFKDRRDEKDVFINTTAGWINLLLMSSSGPVKIPVGACATALQSLEIATILSGKAKVMTAGGFNDLSEEGWYEFANMKATSNAESEFAMGREPTEMSRPATTFMESQGTGVHIVMSAKTALELGAPIRGILAFTSTSTDKAGRSIPAPGLGPLNLRSPEKCYPSILFLSLIWHTDLANLHSLQEELQLCKTQGEPVDDKYFSSRVADIEKEAVQQDKHAFVYEENETRIWNDIFTSIHCMPGKAVPIMAQKSLLGPSKGGSAAWQMVGLIQTVTTDIVPSNRNSDNIDSHFKDRQFLMFLSKSIHTDSICTGVMSSFGFGQVGGTAIIVNPRYLFATLEQSYYDAYKQRHTVRALQLYKSMSEMMIKNELVKIKEAPPYNLELEAPVLLNSLARASLDAKTESYTFKAGLASKLPMDTTNVSAINANANDSRWCSMKQSYRHLRLHPFKSLGVKSKGAAAAMLDIEILNDDETRAPAVTLHGMPSRLLTQRFQGHCSINMCQLAGVGTRISGLEEKLVHVRFQT